MHPDAVSGDAVRHLGPGSPGNEDRKIVGAGDVGRQLEKSLENLAVALAAVGAQLDQVGVLRLNIRLSDISTRARRSSAALKAA